MLKSAGLSVVAAFLCVSAFGQQAVTDDGACLSMASKGLRPIAKERSTRFLGKVHPDTARCRGGETAVNQMRYPWIDWQHYYATGDITSQAAGFFANFPFLGPNPRGTLGALMDLEYQRIELIKFNLLDNSGTYPQYLSTPTGPTLKTWDAMKLPKDSPFYSAVGGAGAQQCKGNLIRHRELTGICNDLDNPAMGSTGMLFARNVQFESTFPNLGKNELARNRNGDRLDTLRPDPQLISRVLFTRGSSADRNCKLDYSGDVYPNDEQPASVNCDYVKAPFFNVLAAFWIQFMTHDWFSHLVEGANAPAPYMKMGCENKLVDGKLVPLTEAEIAKLGCRPGDVVDRGLIADKSEPSTFDYKGKQVPSRAYQTMGNMNTAWWDASQIYGYDERSQKRVHRDPKDRAKLAMQRLPSRANEAQGYLPLFGADDPIIPQWTGQETAAFPDNWSVGMSFYHTVFSREHNLFVDEFRRVAKSSPNADSGLRNPANPAAVIRYRDVSDDELFEAARLVVAAEIAKIHTTEWTPQLLYDKPLADAMKANWYGIFDKSKSLKRTATELAESLAKSSDPSLSADLYSVAASGSGIFGLGNTKPEGMLWWKTDAWKFPSDANSGVHHFGSPFNFPEEFVTVYRLHPLVPDLIEYREWQNPNPIKSKIAVASGVRGNATAEMENRGVANWALSFGRQRLGKLSLGNHPRFLQNLSMPRLGEGKVIDVLALDLIRDRERGVPRFNEFRRQYGLRQLTSFDDFTDPNAIPADRKVQQEFAAKLRTIYGQHKCDASKQITVAQVNADGSVITDCLGHPDGSMVDNIEDVDTVVGWLAESPRPHGFAISETQFQVFILNASRRLFSDRFFTSSFRPEFYTTLGTQWVTNNGASKEYESKPSNGEKIEVYPLKRVLMRTIPELQGELSHVVNAFDPWARDRGEYFSVAWTPRPGAESDPAFK